MAQGDAYVYEWTTGTVEQNLTLTPSAGTEWMFVSCITNCYTSSGSGIRMNILTTGTGSSFLNDLPYFYSPYSTSSYSDANKTSSIQGASGGYGWNTGNMKIIATNSSPARWLRYGGSASWHGKFMAIVINE